MNLAKAKYDNLAECPDELAFRRGDVLTVVDQSLEGLSGWWICNLRGKQGIVPANRLTLLAGMYNESSLLFTTDSADGQPQRGSNASREGHEYDIPRSFRSSNTPNSGTGSVASQGDTVYDSPKHLIGKDSSSSLHSSSSNTSLPNTQPLYDKPSSISGSTSASVAARYGSVVDSAIDSFNYSSDRSSSLYDYPSSMSDGYSSSSGGFNHESHLRRPSNDPIYDNNTSAIYSTPPAARCNSRGSSNVGKNHPLGTRLNPSYSVDMQKESSLYDVIPPTAPRPVTQSNGQDVGTAEQSGFLLLHLPEDLNLDSALQIVVKLQQLIHTSIARLKTDCLPTVDSHGGRLSKAGSERSYETVLQTLLISLRKMAEVAQRCVSRALQCGKGKLASGLEQQIMSLLKGVDSLVSLTEGGQTNSQALSSLCHTITEDVTKLCALIHGNITVLFDQDHYSTPDPSAIAESKQDAVDDSEFTIGADSTVARTLDDNEYDYCELRQSEPDEHLSTASEVGSTRDGAKYVSFYTTHIRSIEGEVKALLHKMEMDVEGALAEGTHRKVIVAVHKTVYICDSLARALSDISSTLVARLVAVVNTLCLSIKKIVLLVKELSPAPYRVATTGRNAVQTRSKPLTRVYEELRSTYRQLGEVLQHPQWD